MKPHAFRLARGLLSLLPGRLWDGKEEVLSALVRILGKCPEVVVVAEEEGEGGEEGAWLLWEKGERVFPPALLGEGGKGEQRGEEAGGVAPMEEDAEAEAAQAVAETRDEEEFQRIAEDAANVANGAVATAIATATPMEIGGVAAGGGRISYHGVVRMLALQCQRPHRDYRRAAVKALTDLALAFPDADAFALGEGPLRGLMEEEEGEDGSVGAGVDHVLRARAVEALGALFSPVPPSPAAPTSSGARQRAAAHATQQGALPWLLPALFSRATYTVWSLRQAVFKALRRVAERAYVHEDDNDSPGDALPTLLSSASVDAIVGACLQGVGDPKFHQVRAAAVEVLLALVKRREGEARLVLAPQVERVLAALDRLVAGDSQPAVVLLATEARAHFQARA